MRIRLLGGFGVDRDGTPVAPREWRLRKARTLVKLLALTPDQRMHRDALLEILWPDRDLASAVNNLHQAAHIARRVLAGDGPHAGWLELRDDVVILWSEGPVDVDVRDFERLAVQARGGDDLAARRAAIAAYTGDLLPEDRFSDWAVRRREELRESVCDLLVDAAEKSADETEALAAAQRALTLDALHERAVRSLMRRLAAAGRRSEALARYERLRDDLRTAYGTDPDPETRQLYRALLTRDAEWEPEREASPRHNLAPALTSFVGREREIADVHCLIAPGGLLTLTGVGGAGKTRLAEEAARRRLPFHPDGVWIAELAQIRDPHLVADAVAEALGLDPSAGSDPLRTLVGRLRPRTLLLVLDNCEHLLAACAELAAAVRRSCPGVTLLATSREPLHVAGEVTFRVPSLDLPDSAEAADPDRLTTFASVRLFVDRARDGRPGFVLDAGNAGSVVEICRRLDGIPLAIELAAARMSHLEAVEIAERLNEALSLLGRRGAVTRHATLRAALEWSHALLAEDEQILLRRLAVFAGSFPLAAVEQVCADERLSRAEVLDCLGRIVDKSLVQIEPAGDRSRYRLLETIRQLARERLDAAGEVDAFESAHCRHFLDLARRHDTDRMSGIVVERPQALDIDHDNLRAALGWALHHDPARALQLAVSLWRYWLARGHFVEGAGWLERVLEVSPVIAPERSRALFATGVLEARRGHGRKLPALGDAGVAAAEASGTPRDAAYARLMRGTLLLGVGRLDEAQRAATAILTAARLDGTGSDGTGSDGAGSDGGGGGDDDGSGPDGSVAAAAGWLSAQTALFREDLDVAARRFTDCIDQLRRIDPASPPFLPAMTACTILIPVAGSWVPVFEESWLLGRRVGAAQGHGYALSGLGYVHRLAADLPAALDTTRSAVDVFARIGDDAGRAHALNHLGCVERDARLFDAADRHLREALQLRERLGDRRGENLSLANLGLLRAAAGDIAQGRRLARIALDRGEATDDSPAVGGALLSLAVVELFAGERHDARVLADQAAEAFEPQGYLRLSAWTRMFAAELAFQEGDRDVAGRHGRAAAAMFAQLGDRIGAARAAALGVPARRAERR